MVIFLHKYNLKRDLVDFRDYEFKISEPIILPPVVDIRANCGKIYDQGDLGSCTSQAGVSAIDFLENVDNITPREDLSRLFLYYNERLLENSTRSDSGASVRDVCKALNKYGVCSESLDPYIISKFRNKPSNDAYNDGVNHKCTEYFRLNGMNDIKNCLYSGFPIIFGFSVYSSFDSDTVTQTGIVPMPSRRERMLGGHCTLIVGYSDEKKWFICKNSWGADWGDLGYFYLPYSYLSLMSDFWKITKVTGF